MKIELLSAVIAARQPQPVGAVLDLSDEEATLLKNYGVAVDYNAEDAAARAAVREQNATMLAAQNGAVGTDSGAPIASAADGKGK